jgi:hypothetical protein
VRYNVELLGNGQVKVQRVVNRQGLLGPTQEIWEVGQGALDNLALLIKSDLESQAKELETEALNLRGLTRP